MGVLCTSEDREKNNSKGNKNGDINKSNPPNKTNEIKDQNNIDIIEEKNLIIPDNNSIKEKEKEDKKLKNIPKNLMNIIKSEYHYILKDILKNETFEDNIKSDSKIYDLFNNLNLRTNADFIIEFENNIKIDYDKINETFHNIITEVFGENIPEKIEMNYTYKGLDIPEKMNDILEAYIESNKIIGSAILDNPDLFTIITYEKELKLIKPYYYKRKENEELIKFNSFTAFCNGKGKLYFSGGENEQTYDPDKTVAKYNDFFYIDLTNLNEDKIEIKELPNLIESRTWHSMIFIPDKYIFIVGGSNTKSVEMYNMETNDIIKDSELNEFRSECTLCLVNNTYLYAFCGFLIHQEYNTTIERCNLLREKRKWEYIILNEKEEFNLNPSFFGISYFKDDQILLIGSNDNGSENHYDYIYKSGINDEEKDKIDEFKCNLIEPNIIFKEKLFLPIEENKAINIPLIIGEEIKAFILDTDTGDITIEKYEEKNT